MPPIPRTYRVNQRTNPRWITEMPGSWDPVVKRWAIGLAAAAWLVGLGVEHLISGRTDVPVPVNGRGLEWIAMEGAGARWFGVLQIGFAIFLNGRYYFRLHRAWWRHSETVQDSGLGLTAIGVIMTSIEVWKVVL